MNEIFHLEQIVYNGTNDMESELNIGHGFTKPKQAISFEQTNNQTHTSTFSDVWTNIYVHMWCFPFFVHYLCVIAYDLCNLSFVKTYGFEQRHCKRSWKMNHQIKFVVRIVVWCAICDVLFSVICWCLLIRSEFMRICAFFLYYCVLFEEWEHKNQMPHIWLAHLFSSLFHLYICSFCGWWMAA